MWQVCKRIFETAAHRRTRERARASAAMTAPAGEPALAFRGILTRAALALVLVATVAAPLAGCGEGSGGRSEGGNAAAETREEAAADGEEATEAAARAKRRTTEVLAVKREEAELAAKRKQWQAAIAKQAAETHTGKKHHTHVKKHVAAKRTKTHTNKSGKHEKNASSKETPAEKAAREHFAKEEAQEAAAFKRREKQELRE